MRFLDFAPNRLEHPIMRRYSSLIPILGILVVALLLGGLVGWWASRGPTGPPPRKIVETPPEPAQPQEEASVEEKEVAPIVDNRPEPVPVYDPPEEPLSAKNWEDKVDEVLTNDKIDYPEKADKLADMIPMLPTHAQKDIAEHLVNLVADEDFHKKAARILLDEHINKDVTEVLFTDLMNRSETLRLPLALKIAKSENHPLRNDAKEMLEMSLQEEFGTDWEKWQSAVDESLKSQGLEVDPALADLLGAATNTPAAP